MKNSQIGGISLPINMWNVIDKQRKDVSRSKFILRLIEEAFSVRGINVK